MPEMFVLGDYDFEQKTGPAIWLRCVIANKISRIELPAGLPPVLYLPGVSRQDLRAVESCPDGLKPIAELQYSGVLWSQANAKDWTILAFLKSDQGGLGLDAAQDTESRHAMQLALYVCWTKMSSCCEVNASTRIISIPCLPAATRCEICSSG